MTLRDLWLRIRALAAPRTFTLSGIYGVLSYLVEQRRRNLAVCIALGATAGNVTRLVLWESLRLVGFGLAAGVFLAWIVSTILTSKLPVRRAHSPALFNCSMVWPMAQACWSSAWLVCARPRFLPCEPRVSIRSRRGDTNNAGLSSCQGRARMSC